ncbi:MAG: PHP domain-containing protein [Phycisphaerae bacterium]|jgi:hypothetical protein
MKVELHLHTDCFSPCARSGPAEMMTRLVQTGYKAVYITEHDALWSDQDLADLQNRYPTLRIFRGVEVTLNLGSGERNQHMLVLGTSDRRYTELANEPAALVAKARAEGCLTILAHPFRWEGSARILAEGIVPDALEYCTCNQEGGLAQQAMAKAEELDIPFINAGDSHGVDFINRFWIETDVPLIDGRDIRPIVLGGQYRNCINPQMPARTW